MVFIILVILMIAVGHLIYYKDNFNMGGTILLYLGYMGLILVSSGLINRSIQEKIYHIKFEEKIKRFETSEYSKSIKEDVYYHNTCVRSAKALKKNAFVGVFISNAQADCPTLKYKKLEGDKFILIQGE